MITCSWRYPRGSEDLCRGFWSGILGLTLGLTEITKPAGLAGRGGVWYQTGASELHLGVEQDFRPAKKAHPAFAAADIDGLAQKLQAVNIAVAWNADIADRRRFFTEDPVGNRVEILGAE